MNQQVDLLPGGYRTRDVLRERSLHWLAIGALLVLTIALAAFVLRWEAAKLDVKVKRLRTNITMMQSWEQMVLPLAGQLEDAQNQRRVVNALLSEPSWAGLLRDVAQAAEGDLRLVSLRAQRLESGAAATDGRREAPRTVLGLVGRAASNETVVRFVKALGESPHLEDVTLVRSHRATEQDESGPVLLAFDIEAVLAGTRGASPIGAAAR